MADGAVQFITDSVEAGDQKAPVIGANLGGPPHQQARRAPTVFGVLWVAVLREVIEEQLNQ